MSISELIFESFGLRSSAKWGDPTGHRPESAGSLLTKEENEQCELTFKGQVC